MRILFVCLGNICRSPIAEGVMKELVNQYQLDWIIDSAGTESYHVGEAPHPHSQQVCAEHQIDISQQRASHFHHGMIQQYDRIYAMAADVLEEIKEISGKQFDPDKVQLFLEALYPHQHRSVKDPWYGTLPGYYEVYEEIRNGCEAIVQSHKSRQQQ